jgi:hypothetical protein
MPGFALMSYLTKMGSPVPARLTMLTLRAKEDPEIIAGIGQCRELGSRLGRWQGEGRHHRLACEERRGPLGVANSKLPTRGFHDSRTLAARAGVRGSGPSRTRTDLGGRVLLLSVGPAASLTFATVLPLASVLVGLAATLPFAGVLAFAGVLGTRIAGVDLIRLQNSDRRTVMPGRRSARRRTGPEDDSRYGGGQERVGNAHRFLLLDPLVGNDLDLELRFTPSQCGSRVARIEPIEQLTQATSGISSVTNAVGRGRRSRQARERTMFGERRCSEAQ